jgi:condensin complex subunit 3
LPLKKGTSQADRLVKFIGEYTKFTNEKGKWPASSRSSLDVGNLAVEQALKPEEDTTASQFTARLLKFLLQGFLAKDKAVCYRVLRLVAEMVSHLGKIE